MNSVGITDIEQTQTHMYIREESHLIILIPLVFVEAECLNMRISDRLYEVMRLKASIVRFYESEALSCCVLGPGSVCWS